MELMNQPVTHRFVTSQDKAQAATDLRRVRDQGFIDDQDLARRLHAVERSEDEGQLVAATGGAGNRPVVEGPSTLMLALPHILGVFTAWVGPLAVWLFGSDVRTKREASKALNFQLIGVVLGFLLGALGLEPLALVVNIGFAFIGGVASIVVAQGGQWSYRPGSWQWPNKRRA